MTLLEPALAGLLLGVANAAHCAGMCGAFAIRAAGAPGARGAFSFGAYALGKALSYIAVGAVVGVLSGALSGALAPLVYVQAWIAIAVGITVLALGVRMFRPRVAPHPLVARVHALLAVPMAELTSVARSTRSHLLFGAATGFLPCGVVYLAALQSSAWGSPLAGASSMAAFGLGTVPVLGAVAIVGRTAAGRLNGRTTRIVGATLVVAAGVIVTWRAALPLLSGGEITCCH